MKVWAVLDLDGTLFDGTVGVFLLRELADRGICPPQRAAVFLDGLRRLRPDALRSADAAARAYRGYADLVAGVEQEAVEAAAQTVWRRERHRLLPSTLPALALLSAHGHTPLLLSGSPAEIVAEAAADLGIIHWRAAEFPAEHGVHTGRTGLLPGTPGAKAALVAALSGDLSRSVAVGNSAADLDHLKIVGHPIAFEPHPSLARTATARGWPAADRTTLPDVLKSVLENGTRA